MTPKTKKQFEEYKKEKREAILESALEVVATHGYHGSSVSMIAKKAGIAKGLLYSYFESKEDLLRAIIENGVRKILEIFEPAMNKELTPELFHELFGNYIKLLKENKSFWRLYYAITMQPVVMELIVNEYEEMGEPFLKKLSDYYKGQGSSNPEADAVFAHSLIDGFTMNYVMTHHDLGMEKFEKLLLERLEKPNF